MASNQLIIPELNPVIFYESTRENLPKYFTKYLGDFMFRERLYAWQQRSEYVQVWQTTDIINLQFESTFDPIVVKLVDENGNTVIILPALKGMPNKYIPNTFSFDVSMSLGDLATGYYFLQIELGSLGPQQKILISDCQYISNEQIENSLLLEYFNSRFHGDVIFETGIKFQFRVFGNFGFLDKSRASEIYRDEKYTSTLLSSKSAKQWPVNFGDEYGLPDEVINLIDEIWSCDHVSIDGKPFGIADGTKPEYPTVESDNVYPKRGMRITVEAGINRNSKIFAIDTDTNKKLVTSIIVDAKVFGDTSNQGSANTIPVFNIENE